jgi:hypothetical protein
VTPLQYWKNKQQGNEVSVEIVLILYSGSLEYLGNGYFSSNFEQSIWSKVPIIQGWINLHFRVSVTEAWFIFPSVYSHPLVDLFYDEYILTQVHWYV